MLRSVTFCMSLLIALPAVIRAETPPNIVFCFADDWGRYASCYAGLDNRPTVNDVIKTPNIDAVAKRGAIFRNAFVNAPSCTPCRSALLSGRYFFATGRGAILVGAVWDKDIPTFPLMLKDAGYAIGKTGKVWSPGMPADAPIGGQAHAYQKAGMRFNQFSQNMTMAVRAGTPLEEARAGLYKQVGENIKAMLLARKPNQPFFYFFGPTNPHRLWVKGSGKALWNLNPDDLKGKLPANLPDVHEVREDFADYLGECQAFDAYVGVLVNELQQAGELDNTIIVISGDHGAPGFPGGKCNLYDFGVHVPLVAAGPKIPGGRVIDDFVNLMDLAPTFLELGGVKPAPGMHGKSIVPQLRSEQAGQIDPARTWVITGRERHVGNARAGNLPYPQRALRTPEFLYIRNYAPDRMPMGDAYAVTEDDTPTIISMENNTRLTFPDMDAGPTKAWLIANRKDPKWKRHYEYAFGKRPAEELYELKSDPDQMTNVAADARFQSVKLELAERLEAELRKKGDPRIVDEECRFEKMPFVSPDPASKK